MDLRMTMGLLVRLPTELDLQDHFPPTPGEVQQSFLPSCDLLPGE